MPEQVTITTKDGIKLAGDYSKVSDKAVLLLHMMPATKVSWSDFSKELDRVGFTTLAIDLRGHGESGGGDYRKFTDEQHQDSIMDVEAAIAFLRDEGMKDISLVGASIGANLALQYQAGDREIKKIVLLSPGLDYRGISPLNFTSALQDYQSVFIASEKSLENGAKEIAKNIENSGVKIYQTGEHGTNLFKVDPSLMRTLIDWLDG